MMENWGGSGWQICEEIHKCVEEALHEDVVKNRLIVNEFLVL